MCDHIGLHVKDLDASVRFYEATLGALGHALCSRDDTSAGLGPRDAPALWLYGGPTTGTPPTTRTRSQAHVAFKAASRAAVDQFYRRGLEAGGRDNGKPGVRADYAPTYYAAFLVDPDGNNVEAVCMEAP